ncbi:unnamed protein product [Citrullus colocynthis]|uniref:Uncharacterized protein n=1 Tax=Citrullus colocynthis TaxID=252529 RepID=A0ABP0XV71_9ROSI
MEIVPLPYPDSKYDVAPSLIIKSRSLVRVVLLALSLASCRSVALAPLHPDSSSPNLHRRPHHPCLIVRPSIRHSTQRHHRSSSTQIQCKTSLDPSLFVQASRFCSNLMSWSFHLCSWVPRISVSVQNLCFRF